MLFLYLYLALALPLDKSHCCGTGSQAALTQRNWQHWTIAGQEMSSRKPQSPPANQFDVLVPCQLTCPVSLQILRVWHKICVCKINIFSRHCYSTGKIMAVFKTEYWKIHWEFIFWFKKNITESIIFPLVILLFQNSFLINYFFSLKSPSEGAGNTKNILWGALKECCHLFQLFSYMETAFLSFLGCPKEKKHEGHSSQKNTVISHLESPFHTMEHFKFNHLFWNHS